MSTQPSPVKLETQHVEDGDRRVQFDATAGFDGETERRLTKSLLRKLDTRMLPMLAVLFLFSFLDRTNIGNAKVSSEKARADGRSSAFRPIYTSMLPNTRPASLYFLPFTSPRKSPPIS